MLKRCHSEGYFNYKSYGGRGIRVCDEWRNDIMPFFNWSMANGYQEGLQIDRIDNDAGYSPDNCRWVAVKVNANNRRTKRLVAYKGKEYTVSELAQKLNMEYDLFYARLRLEGFAMDSYLFKYGS